jgi:hypothetical protein
MDGKRYIEVLYKYKTKFNTYPVIFFDASNAADIMTYVLEENIKLNNPCVTNNTKNYIFFSFDYSYSNLHRFIL